ncbi:MULTISPECIES: putative holin-like toxin [unclassified Paenibacillus]
MSKFESLSLLVQFGMLILSLIAIIISIVRLNQKQDRKRE